MEFNFNKEHVEALERKRTNEKKKYLKHTVDKSKILSGILCVIGLIAMMVGIAAISYFLLPGRRITSAVYVMGGGCIIKIIKDLIFNVKGGNYNNISTYCQSKGIDITDVENDFENSVYISEKLISVGDKYMIFIDRVILVDEICWVFYEQYKLHNSKTKKKEKYFLEICCKDGNVIKCEVEDIIAAMALNQFSKLHSHVILGHSVELEKLFRNERDEFLAKADYMRPESIYELKRLEF